MKNVMQRCLALIILFENKPKGIDADYIKDSIHQYRNLSSSAFHRSFERDKDVLRSMGFVINYINDKWALDPGYELSGTNIWKDIQHDQGENSFEFLTTFLYFKNIINFHEGSDKTLNNDKFSLLQNAITNKLRVSFIYKKDKRVVYPYAFKLHKDIWYLCALDSEKSKTFFIKHMDNIKIGNKKHNKDLSKYDLDTKFSWEDSNKKIEVEMRIDKRAYFLYQNVFIHKKIQFTEDEENFNLKVDTFDDYGLKIFLLLTVDECKYISINDKAFVKDMIYEV